MRGPGIPRLAWRNLWRNRRRTALTLVAISFGLFLAIMFTSLQDRSFADMIDLAARMSSGHVTVQHPEYQDTPSLTRTVPDAAQVIAAAERTADVGRAVPRITGPVMLATAGQSYGAFFIAIDPALEDKETLSYLDGLKEGAMLQSADDNGIVLGQRLAKNLKVELGSKVVYTLMDRNGQIVSGLARLTGVVDTGAASVDGSLALLPLGTLRSLLSYGPDEATQVAIFISDSRRSPEVREALSGQLGGGVAALTWDEVQAELSGFIAMKVGGARFMEGVIMLLVAASIFNTLLVSVLERRREFGIMMAIGWSPAQIFGLVMAESAWLALVGVAVGGLVTLGPYRYLATHPIDVSAVAGNQNMDIAGVGMAATLNIGIYPESLAVIVIAVVGATMLSGLYPAWQAGRTVPVETIKLV